MGYNVKIDTIEELQDFIQAAIKTEGEVSVKQCGYIVNGKSILGILSLDLREYVVVSVANNDYSQFKYFIDKN